MNGRGLRISGCRAPEHGIAFPHAVQVSVFTQDATHVVHVGDSTLIIYTIPIVIGCVLFLSLFFV